MSEVLSREELLHRARAARELELRALRARCTGPGSLIEFVRTFWHVVEPVTRLKEGWVLDAICTHLEEVTAGRIKRLLINVPPGSMKSLLCNCFWPAWEWQTMPHTRWLSFSYASHLTERDNEKFRDIIQSPIYQQMWARQWQLRKQNVTQVMNSMRGSKLASSVGGVGTGERGDRVVLDDPHNVAEGESETIREATTTWFTTAMSNRLNDLEESAVVVIMQRVHESDVSGIILSKNLGYTHLMVPAEYDEARHCQTWLETPQGSVPLWEDPRTQQGETFWPERFPPAVLRRMKRTLGPYGYSGQYQQSPEPGDGGIFKRAWWKLWGNPEDPEDERFLRFPPMSFVVASLDGAYTKNHDNDPSALTVWGVFNHQKEYDEATHFASHAKGEDSDRFTIDASEAGTPVPQIMLMRAWSEHLELHELVEKVHKTCQTYKVHRLLIEAKATGISAAQELRRRYRAAGYDVQLINPGDLDKVARAYAAQPWFARGVVWAPDRQWADDVIEQMARFPKAEHDDYVDTASMALNYLRKIGVLEDREDIEVRDREAVDYENTKPLAPIYPV